MVATIDLSIIVVYLIILIFIGYISSRKQTGMNFMISNRNLGTFSFVSTLIASIIGATALVIYTAYIFEFGVGAVFGFIGIFIGLLFFLGAAKKLRKLSHKERFYTIPDFFHHFFSNKIGNLSAILILSVVFMSLVKQFVAGTQILSTISGFDYGLALLISSSVIFIYLILGGFRSVVKTDIFQYLILILILFIIGSVTGNSVNLTLSEFSKTSMGPLLILSFLVYGLLLPWVSVDIWQRVYAARNDKVIKRGFLISGVLLLLIGLGITLIGLSTRIAFPNIDPSQALVYGLSNLLSPGILGLGIVLAFAAIMSTADTLIFILATNISKDFIARFKKKSLSDEELMKYTRINIVGIIIIVTFLAYFFRNIIDIAIVQAGLAMSLAPTVIGRFKWKLKRNAAKVSILSGIVYVILVSLFWKITPEIMFSSVLVSTILLIISQKISKK